MVSGRFGEGEGEKTTAIFAVGPVRSRNLTANAGLNAPKPIFNTASCQKSPFP